MNRTTAAASEATLDVTANTAVPFHMEYIAYAAMQPGTYHPSPILFL